MQVQELLLTTPDLSAQKTFYRNVLKLPVTAESEQQFTVQAGTTKLTFAQGALDGVYHFAFNIPENQIAEARKWLAVPLIKASDGRDEFFSENWNAHNIYFYDPAGNILELIARHTLPNASTEPFSEKSLLNISEIGIGVEDVKAFTESCDLPHYGSGSDEFAPMGDENGLLIVVKLGRVWFPDTGKPALEIPLRVGFSANGKQLEIKCPL
jgi:catechol 2,3-dioxygenase-like lactoylglutathione lyase family enzyme